MDDKGLFDMTGRESDMYISGGSNICPREVEEVLLRSQSGWRVIENFRIPCEKFRLALAPIRAEQRRGRLAIDHRMQFPSKV